MVMGVMGVTGMEVMGMAVMGMVVMAGTAVTVDTKKVTKKAMKKALARARMAVVMMVVEVTNDCSLLEQESFIEAEHRRIMTATRRGMITLDIA